MCINYELGIEEAHFASAVLGVNRAAILTSILRRQALRRETQLPLLDIRAEYDRAVEQAVWQAYVEEYGEAVRAEVLSELLSRLGPQFGNSVGGLWAVRLRTEKRLRDMFAGKARSARFAQV